jgi:ribulose 1,5-bisphosphate carboxylase large subunit-like protein
MKAVSRTNEYRKVVSEEIFGEFTKDEMEFMDEAFQRLNRRLNDILAEAKEESR